VRAARGRWWWRKAGGGGCRRQAWWSSGEASGSPRRGTSAARYPAKAEYRRVQLSRCGPARRGRGELLAGETQVLQWIVGGSCRACSVDRFSLHLLCDSVSIFSKSYCTCFNFLANLGVRCIVLIIISISPFLPMLFRRALWCAAHVLLMSNHTSWAGHDLLVLGRTCESTLICDN
jgi:hypothetical protein